MRAQTQKKRVRALKRLDELIVDKEHTLFLDFIKKVLQVDPETRITANEALDHPYFESLREKYRSQSQSVEQKSLKRSLSSEDLPAQPNKRAEYDLSESVERSQISQNDLTSKSRGNSLSLSGSYNNMNSFIEVEEKQPNFELYHKEAPLLNTSRDNEEFLNFAMKEANLESQYP